MLCLPAPVSRSEAVNGHVWPPCPQQCNGPNSLRACTPVSPQPPYPCSPAAGSKKPAPIRHGWGITPNPQLATTYLSFAASSAAAVESQALSSGMKKGGVAKGELVLAMYELANSFRHGWGVQVDPVAARSYYETAANLGDTDAMNEVARCYEEGFGGKKDRVSGVVLFWFSGSLYFRGGVKSNGRVEQFCNLRTRLLFFVW